MLGLKMLNTVPRLAPYVFGQLISVFCASK